MPINTSLAINTLQMYLQNHDHFYKTLQENEPQYLTLNLHMTTGERMTGYNKSNTILLQVPINKKKTQGDRGFSFTGPNYWNKLPNYIKEAEKLEKFKELLKTHFLDFAIINNHVLTDENHTLIIYIVIIIYPHIPINASIITPWRIQYL